MTNNAGLYGLSALEAFRKYKKCRPDKFDASTPELEQFAYFECMTACTAFKYEIGEIVMVNGEYKTVAGYDTWSPGCSTVDSLWVTTDGKTEEKVFVHPDEVDKYKTTIPKGLFDLVAKKLAEKCPLKEAGCV